MQKKRSINRQSHVNGSSGQPGGRWLRLCETFTLSAFEAQLLLLVGEVSGDGSYCCHDDCTQDGC